MILMTNEIVKLIIMIYELFFIKKEKLLIQITCVYIHIENKAGFMRY